MVIGDKQKFVSALIVPAEEALKSYCEQKEIAWTSLQEIIENEAVLEQYQNIINKFNPEFSHVEQIKKFKLIASPWLPLKLKRRVIREKFKKEIADIYA